MNRNFSRFLRTIHHEFAEPSQFPIAGRDTHPFLGYALNVMHEVEAASDDAGALVGWLSQNRRRLGLADELFIDGDGERCHRHSSLPPIGRPRWHAFGAALTERYFAAGGDQPAAGAANYCAEKAIEVALQKVDAALGFDELDTAIFGIIFRYRNDNAFDRLFDSLATAQGRAGTLRGYPDLFAFLISAQTKDVAIRFQADSALLSSGAVGVDEDGDTHLAARLCHNWPGRECPRLYRLWRHGYAQRFRHACPPGANDAEG